MFPWFSTGFTRFSKSHILLKLHFCTGPLRSLRSLQKCPWFALRPSERLGTLQCSPRAPADGGPAKFRRTRVGDRPGAGGGGGGWPPGPWGSIPVVGLGRGTTGGRSQRSGAVTTAGATAPARLHLRRGKRRFGRLGWRSTVVVMHSNRSMVAWDWDFPVQAAMASWRTAWRTRGATSRLYRRRVGEGVRASRLRVVRH
jgi:hypothetical protein